MCACGGGSGGDWNDVEGAGKLRCRVEFGTGNRETEKLQVGERERKRGKRRWTWPEKRRFGKITASYAWFSAS